MEKVEFITYNSIRSHLNIETSLFSVYIKELWNDLTDNEVELDKGISRITFGDYFKLPLFICNKLFCVFDKKNTGYVNFKDFSNIMTKLYLGTFEDTAQMIFNIYDFDKDGFVKKEDVRLILSYLPIKEPVNGCKYKNQLESLSEIEEILNETFGSKNDKLHLEEFIQIIENTKSDIYLQLLCFFYNNKPFEEKTINQIKSTRKKAETCPIRSNLKTSASKTNLETLKSINTTNIPFPSKSTHFISCENFLKKSKPYKTEATDSMRNSKLSNSSNLETVSLNISMNKDMNMTDGYKIVIHPKNEESLENSSETKIKRSEKKKLTYKEKEPMNLNKTMKDMQMKHTESTKEIKTVKLDTTSYLSNPVTVKSKSSNKELNFKDKSSCNQTDKTLIDKNEACLEIIESDNILDNKMCKIQYEDWLNFKEKDGKLKKCYFTLIGNELSLYKSEKKNELISIQNISGYFVRDGCSDTKLVDKEKYYYFVLYYSKEKSRYYYCNNFNNKNRWVENIKLAINDLNIFEYYELSQKLGEGLFGVVKKAINLKTNEIVAVKIISKNKLQQGEIFLIRNEIDLLKHFKHPNIVRIYDSFETSDEIYIVMEYLGGGDLLNFIEKRNEVSDKTIANIIYSIANVIKYLNSYGVVHRDLKPENIMLLNEVENPTVKIIDFGLTKIIEDGEKLYDAFGTIAYVAPEVLLQKPYSKQVDIWSLGVIMYFLFSNGKLPFEDKDNNEEQIAKKALLLDPVFPDEIFGKHSKSALMLVNQCLIKEPEKRINIYNILKNPWLLTNVSKENITILNN